MHMTIRTIKSTWLLIKINNQNMIILVALSLVTIIIIHHVSTMVVEMVALGRRTNMTIINIRGIGTIVFTTITNTSTDTVVIRATTSWSGDPTLSLSPAWRSSLAN
jgi:hypothetical protein